MEDTELALKAPGDPAALTELISKYYQRTYRFVCSHGINEYDAEDVTQEIYLTLVKSLGAFRGESSFPTWFRRIEISRIYDYFRAKAATPVLVVHRHIGRTQPVDSMNIADFAPKLSDKYRKTINARFWEGKKYAEIAAEYGISEEGARSLCRRAINKVSKAYRRVDMPAKKQVHFFLSEEECMYLERFQVSRTGIFRALLRLIQQTERPVELQSIALAVIQAKLGLV